MSEMRRPLAKTVWMAHTVTSGEASAGSIDMYIYSGGSREDFQFVAQVRRSNEDRYGFDWSYSSGTGVITVASNTDSLTENDVCMVIGSFGDLE